MGTEVAPGRDTWASDLTQAIRNRSVTVGVVGLGYVGLALAVAAAAEGFPIVGVDVDEERLSALSEGRSYLDDVPDRDLVAARAASFSEDALSLRDAGVIIIAVPTPLTDASPDLSMVKQAGADVARALQPGRLVVLESTTYPGTTEELLRPILETSGLVAGRDFSRWETVARPHEQGMPSMRGTT